MSNFTALTLAATLTLTALPALAEGDAAAGEALWSNCRSCHSLVDAAGTALQRGGRSAPNLFGLPGRAVASVEGFNYGDDMEAYAATGAVWTEELFVEYVTNPQTFLRTHLNDNTARSSMSYRMRTGQADMWAYLVSVSPAAE